MSTRNVAPNHGWPEAGSFPETLRAEEEPSDGYWQNPPVPIIQDHWYWGPRLNAPASADMVFTLPPFDDGAVDETLRVLVAGRTVIPLLDPDHHTRVHLNGTALHDAWWDGMVEHTHEVEVPAGLLAEGANTVTLETVGDTGAPVDIVQPNWLELDYRRLYRADDDSLRFAAPAAGSHRMRVAGFGGNEVVVLDVTDPARPVRLTGATLEASGGGFDLVLEDTASATSRFQATGADAVASPAAVIADQASDLRAASNGADLVIIAHADFLAALQPLVAHREAQGLRVELVDLEDVYDEFSFGLSSPEAIRDLLAHAYAEWTPPALSAALLVGDGDLDYLDRFGSNLATSVPTYITDVGEVGETASEAFFARIDGDDLLPDIAVGRLPARSAASVEVMVDKIIAYETSPPAGDWKERLVLVADDGEPEFEQVSDAVATVRPPGYRPTEIYAADFPPGTPQQAILDAFQDGAALISYVGHGNYDRWGTWSGGGSLLSSGDVAGLTNAGKLPLVFTATCLNGFFVYPSAALALSEALVTRDGGGAVATWSPSALGYPVDHEILFTHFLEALPRGSGFVLGSATLEATVLAMADGIPTELASTFILLGDPLLTVTKPPLARTGGDRTAP
jgi:hypothetical protein